MAWPLGRVVGQNLTKSNHFQRQTRNQMIIPKQEFVKSITSRFWPHTNYHDIKNGFPFPWYFNVMFAKFPIAFWGFPKTTRAFRIFKSEISVEKKVFSIGTPTAIAFEIVIRQQTFIHADIVNYRDVLKDWLYTVSKYKKTSKWI